MLRLDQIGQALGFPSVLTVMKSQEQDIGIFAPTAVQLVTTYLQIALSRLFSSWDITPVAVVGHSLGKYAALNIAGVLSDADTVYLVGVRARLLEEKCTQCTHSMLVVKGPLDAVASALKNTDFEIACINSPNETVIAGLNENVSNFQSLLAAVGMKSTLLKVPYSFHSSQMDAILGHLRNSPLALRTLSLNYQSCARSTAVLSSTGASSAHTISPVIVAKR